MVIRRAGGQAVRSRIKKSTPEALMLYGAWNQAVHEVFGDGPGMEIEVKRSRLWRSATLVGFSLLRARNGTLSYHATLFFRPAHAPSLP